MQFPDYFKPLLAIVACCLGIVGLLSGGPIEQPAGVLVTSEPQQRPTRAAAFNLGEFEVTPAASYDIEARVLSTEKYRVGNDAKLSPIDFAVGWGPMSDSAVLKHFRVRQGGRFFSIYPDEQAVDLKVALSGAANMHLIPATSTLRRELEHTRVGSIVRLRGQLVNIAGPNGYHWNTSLTREDTGAGACEVFYVESFETR
ncbi:MAG: hypothetical protein ABW106_02185 [Steroidobacteraceae bacterium]